METLTRLVSESLARHGFDRPVDYRRLQWSRWFRCESHHSLLTVPSKPGVFAVAEEIMSSETTMTRVGTDPLLRPASPNESKASTPFPEAESRKPEARRMLAVSQFFEDDDMAFVLDRMLSHANPMRSRLASGHYFVRYVVIEDASQRRSICNALNQWIVSSAEKATGIGPHFATSLELPFPEQNNVASNLHVEERRLSAASAALSNAASAAVPAPKTADAISNPQSDNRRVNSAPTLNSAVATNIHCSSSFPSGF
jgi:hypothetical protein